MTTDEFTAAFAAFLVAAQAKITADYARFSPDHPEMTPKLTTMIGKRYVRLVTGNSCFGFVDMDNGNLLKAASWKAPAMNYPRGNIADEHKGCHRITWTGVH